MTSAKRRIDDQIAVAAKAPKLSLLRLQEVLQTNGVLCRSMSDALDISTPFGKLLVTLRLPMIDGSNYNWLVCNPFAFLHLRCQRSERFARLLFDSLKTINDQVHGTIALYSDESCHGNQLRHDSVNELHTFIGPSASSQRGIACANMDGSMLASCKRTFKRRWWGACRESGNTSSITSTARPCSILPPGCFYRLEVQGNACLPSSSLRVSFKTKRHTKEPKE